MEAAGHIKRDQKKIKTFESSTVSEHPNVPREAHLASFFQLKWQTAEFR
jgi:hypothetical protein